jgi:hypothetical protein
MRRVAVWLVAGAAVFFAAALSATAQQYQPCIETGASCIALNPDVTPETIAQTICVPGYTATVRPGSSYVTGIKDKIGRDAGLPSVPGKCLWRRPGRRSPWTGGPRTISLHA